jgi:hypothetical protein
MYKCNHFSVHELVPRSVFEKRGERAWQLLDERLLITLDRLRERYGSTTVNNSGTGTRIVNGAACVPKKAHFIAHTASIVLDGLLIVCLQI